MHNRCAPAGVGRLIVIAERSMKRGSQHLQRMSAIAAIAFALIACGATAADPDKVLRVATFDIDTLDPQQFSDNPSFEVLISIFEPLYEVDYLATPPKLMPLTARGPIELSDGNKTWTMRVKPGIFFTDDPAFKGKPRELVAEDYVYSYKRWIDPNLRRGGGPILTDLIVGARAVVDAARSSGKFDYDRPIEGLRALDRYTVQLRLTDVDYANIQDMLSFVGGAAREVVEAAGADIRTRAVGTGPFRLREWKRGSRIVLEANPGYRKTYFPTSDDPARAALVKSMRGKTVPQVGVVEVNIIEEELTRLLLFEQGGLDYLTLRGDIAGRLLVDGEVKQEYAARGVTRQIFAEPYLFSFNFNTVDPVIGGMSNDRIALRRAIAMAIDLDQLVKVVYGGQALVANQIAPPLVTGYDPSFPARPIYDPAAAMALLDRFGYASKDAEGYRKGPDGKPLTITLTMRSGAVSREMQTLVHKSMEAIGVRMDFHITPFQDAIKEMEQGQFQIIFRGFGGTPSGYPELLQLYGKQPRRINSGLFKLAAYDRAAEAFLRSGTPPEQRAAARTMTDLARTYMPMLPAIFRLENDFVQPWLLGFSPPIFSTYWKYLDIDLARRK
jgi:ABC-type transport system substrate-binding protein